MSDRAYLREVGPRDGLQLVKTVLPTDQKVAWCRALADAGVVEIEATSFVSEKAVPQFADAAAVTQQVLAIAGIRPSVLVPTLRHAVRAFDAGAREVGFVLSASEKHNFANVRRTTDESVAEFRNIVAERKARGLGGTVVLSAAIATSFGCTIEGNVAEARVVELAATIAEAGADEIIVADTVGYANPTQVRRLMSAVGNVVGKVPLRAHFHDTRGLGLANVTGALDAGVRRFDASNGGLGGCPFAPGATGNINSEDCAFLLESMGLETGIDIDRLIAVRRMVEDWLPGERFFGMTARAGLPLTYAAR